MPRHRLGVALLLPPHVSAEVDVLRRALRDPALGRIAPHVTLVPPVNVRADALSDALAMVRAAAAAVAGPVAITLGPAGTFNPVSPVIHLEVTGADDEVGALREACFRPPLWRTTDHAFVPHVTVAETADAAVADVIGGYETQVTITHLTVLERDARWSPLADVALGPPRVVGRGGLEAVLQWSTVPGPDVDAVVGPVEPGGDVVTAWRDERVAGQAVVRDGVLERLHVVEECRGTGLGAALVAEARRTTPSVVVAPGAVPAGFARRLGLVEAPPG